MVSSESEPRFDEERRLTKLERSVLDAALAGDHPVLGALRKQAQACGVLKRELTGAGFFTDLAATPVEPRLHGSCRIGGSFADIEGLEHGAGFVIMVEDGVLALIEGFSYDEPWPAETEEFELHGPVELPDLSGLRWESSGQHE